MHVGQRKWATVRIDAENNAMNMTFHNKACSKDRRQCLSI